MLGTRGRPGMFDNRIIPVEAHGLKVMSIGLLVNEKEPLVWRGPMIHSFIQQMLKDVSWGALDYLVFDMPPGTGDAQLSLSQVLPLGGVVMVTTPQDVALLDVRKAIGMFQRLNVPIAGHRREHEHVRLPALRPGTPPSSATPAASGWPRSTACRCWPSCRSIRRRASGGDEGSPITVRRPDSAQAPRLPRAGGRRDPTRLDDAGRAGHAAEDQLTRAEHGGTGVDRADLPAARRDVLSRTPSCRCTSSRRATARWSSTRSSATGELAVVRLRPGYEASYAGKPAVLSGGRARRDRLAASGWRPGATTSCSGASVACGSSRSCRATRSIGSCALSGSIDAEPTADAAPALARIRAACRALLEALARPADLLDTALAEGQPAGAIADRVAAAVLPDADLRQSLLETLDVAARVNRVAAAVEALVNELKGGRA